MFSHWAYKACCRSWLNDAARGNRSRHSKGRQASTIIRELKPLRSFGMIGSSGPLQQRRTVFFVLCRQHRQCADLKIPGRSRDDLELAHGVNLLNPFSNIFIAHLTSCKVFPQRLIHQRFFEEIAKGRWRHQRAVFYGYEFNIRGPNNFTALSHRILRLASFGIGCPSNSGSAFHGSMASG